MKNLSLLNGAGLTKYALQPLAGGKSALEEALSFGESLPDVEKIVLLTDRKEDGLPRGNWIIRQKTDLTDMKSLLSYMAQEGEGFDTVFYYYADCPLLDSGITRKMYDNHLRYFAQYTFADGYPSGLTPELISTSMINSLVLLSGKYSVPMKRDGIFSVLQNDINAFDIETEISPKDLRLLRVSLSCDTKRNFYQTESIIKAGGTDAESIIPVLEEKPELLRTLPSFIGVQICDGCPQACSYCPYPRIGGDVLHNRNFMSADDFRTICGKIHELSDDAVICPSLWGEPALHPDIADCVESVLAYPRFSLCIETSGIGWKPEVLKHIRNLCEEKDGTARIDWILSLDALDPELYSRLRGPGFEEALKTCDLLCSLFPEKVHIQAVRMNSNEENLEAFFRHWKEKTGKVIIQKYDHFCGFLDQIKVTDLSPLKRFPCWHLKRDLSVLIDGSVPVCREDLKKDHILGNILKDSAASIWDKGTSWYEKHCRGVYPGLCKECDEYYTYNF